MLGSRDHVVGGRFVCLLGFAVFCFFYLLFYTDPCVFFSETKKIGFLNAGFFRKINKN